MPTIALKFYDTLVGDAHPTQNGNFLTGKGVSLTDWVRVRVTYLYCEDVLLHTKCLEMTFVHSPYAAYTSIATYKGLTLLKF